MLLWSEGGGLTCEGAPTAARNSRLSTVLRTRYHTSSHNTGYTQHSCHLTPAKPHTDRRVELVDKYSGRLVELQEPLKLKVTLLTEECH